MTPATVTEGSRPEPLERITTQSEYSPEELEILEEMPYWEACLDSQYGRGPIICPACGEGIDREIFFWDIHWKLNHDKLKEKIIALGFDWYKGRGA